MRKVGEGVQKLKNLPTSYKYGSFSPSSICDPRVNPSPMRSGNIIPSVAVGWDDHFLGGLEMNRRNKTDPFMIFSATTTPRGRYCREKGQDVGIFRSEEEAPQIRRVFSSVSGRSPTRLSLLAASFWSLFSPLLQLSLLFGLHGAPIVSDAKM